MKKNYIFIVLIAFLLLVSCNKSEDILFDTPFISLESKDPASAGPVNSDQEFIGEYLICLNSSPFSQNIEVTYEIEIGDGLIADRDFQILTQSNTLIFYTGIYDMPIRIKWLRTCVRDANDNIISDSLDESKNTTMTIKLTGNSEGLTLGYPGPKQLKKEITIKKIKALS